MTMPCSDRNSTPPNARKRPPPLFSSYHRDVSPWPSTRWSSGLWRLRLVGTRTPSSRLLSRLSRPREGRARCSTQARSSGGTNLPGYTHGPAPPGTTL
ncbi:hypothetical protein FKM82_028667 [Ascaphus truei]